MTWLEWEWCFEDDELVAPAAPEADDDEAAALLSVSQEEEEEFALAFLEELLEATALLALS